MSTHFDLKNPNFDLITKNLTDFDKFLPLNWNILTHFDLRTQMLTL